VRCPQPAAPRGAQGAVEDECATADLVIGGVLIPTALVKMHTGALARQVKFTGYYLDNVLSEWSMPLCSKPTGKLVK
jgi:hypothetical protein